jgi:hypothetical protein
MMVQTMTLLMMLSSTINTKNFFNPNGWLNDKHLIGIMQMLYIQKL